MKTQAFGVLSESFLHSLPFSNPLQLLWGDDARAFLMQVGCMDVLSDKASDYQRFCAICDAVKASPEHDFSRKVEFFLNESFDHSIVADGAELATLWRRLSKRLFDLPMAAEDFFWSPHARGTHVLAESEFRSLQTAARCFSGFKCESVA